MSSPVYFRSFPHLPIKLQLYIFGLASSTQGPLPIPSTLLLEISRRSLNVKSGIYRSALGSRHLLVSLPFELAFADENVYFMSCRLRAQLEDTCKLARSVVLKAWRKEVDGVDESSRLSPAESERVKRVKKDILDILDPLIAQTTGR